MDSKRAAETSREDIFIRRFIVGTFNDLLASEIILKRKLNTINISFLLTFPKGFQINKAYFLIGYSEELLSSMLKSVVKIDLQTVYKKNDLIFRNW